MRTRIALLAVICWLGVLAIYPCDRAAAQFPGYGPPGAVVIAQGPAALPLWLTMSGDCTLSQTGTITCLNTNGNALGTMALQNANAVAITGGLITGMPAPTTASAVANKQYVDNTAAGLTMHASSLLATVAALPANTYANGTAGVGATLTASANGALSIDGVAVAATNRVVVKNEAALANNGIYVVTNAGAVGAAYVLTRAADANTPGVANANQIGLGTYTFVTSGTANLKTGWAVNSVVTTIGTSAINWAQFTAGGVGTVIEQKNTASGGLQTSGNCDNTSSNALSPCNYFLSAGRQTLPTTSLVTTVAHNGGFAANTAGTYTTPANVLWLEVTLIGGGGGGGAGNQPVAGGNGGNTCWNTTGAACTSPVYRAGGGAGAAAPGAGSGGTVTGACTRSAAGGGGGEGGQAASSLNGLGGAGGNSSLGGGGSAGSTDGAAATGAGAGGGNQGALTGTFAGGGGGAGATCYVLITSPAATYTYAVGGGGFGQSPGTDGNAGSNGAGGQIFIIEHYGS